MPWEKNESCHFKAGSGLEPVSLTDPILLPFPQVPTCALPMMVISLLNCFENGDEQERAPERMTFLLLLNYSSATGP